MKIRISINDENADKILEEGMNCISQAAKDKPEWKKHETCDCFETECDASEDDIVPVFNELIERYPGLDIYALYSYSIREDDSSAQWWGTTKIKTEHHPGGTATLSIDSSTQWF